MKAGKVFFLSAMLVLFFIISAIFAADPSPETPVYVTKSGIKYHRKSCSTLGGSGIPVTLAEAVLAGYEPCMQCRPPVLKRKTLSVPEADAVPLYRVNVERVESSSDCDITRMLQAEVIDSIDGDTVRVRIHNPPDRLKPVEVVRLLGIDTPETVHPNKPVERFGIEASEFTKEALLGREVFLAFDWNLRDRYGRVLAYIYDQQGDCFNALIVRQGYAYAYLEYPFQFAEEFETFEKEAREEGAGLWKEESDR